MLVFDIVQVLGFGTWDAGFCSMGRCSGTMQWVNLRYGSGSQGRSCLVRALA